ncbi:MAG: filamentous hemagglutinin N-terminal domain-containing protein, partial [Spirulinaceae cyanobacterium RM2_2_10]|nr:filamentous hemagglutinin N-terminal domain-containing protein [Spirulinaceae cyanobacterium RM2_2_10]
VLGSEANLFLMNPAGLVFGPNASLNVQGDFFATTATAIGFGGDRWFEAFGSNDYQSLVGIPSQFAFETGGGAIINAGDLAVNPGQHLALLSHQVVNTGQLSAPGGQITLQAIPGTGTVQISQPGHLLRLEITPPRDATGQLLPVTPTDLPALLTGSNLPLGFTLPTAQTLQFSGSEAALPATAGTALISGQLDVSDPQSVGGAIAILGDRLALVGAALDASGTTGGGNIRIGGDYQGQGNIPNAQRTYVSADSRLQADALTIGDGGRVILWADAVTGFSGGITARGGEQRGNGGFVEVSGKQALDFAGTVDVGAPLGLDGTVLLDPDVIVIDALGSDDNQLLANQPPGQPAGTILAADGGTATFTLSVAALAGITGNINLLANNEIRIENAINFNSLNVSFTADQILINAPVTFTNPANFNLTASDLIRTNAAITAGTVNFSGGNIVDINAPLNATTINLTSNTLVDLDPGGDVIGTTVNIRSGDDIHVDGGSLSGGTLNLNAANQVLVDSGGWIDGNNVSLIAGGEITTQNPVNGTNSLLLRSDVMSIDGALTGNGSLVIQPQSPNRPMGLGTPEIPPRLDLEPYEMANIGTGFSSMSFGRVDSVVDVTIGDPAVLQDGMTIRGGNTLIGPDFDTVWTLSGSGQGRFTVAGRTLGFSNMAAITSGSGDDVVRFQAGVDFGGPLDGGDGFDQLDYSLYGGPVTVDLASNQATGTTGVNNFEAVTPPHLAPPPPPPSPPLPPTPQPSNPGNPVPILPLSPLPAPTEPRPPAPESRRPLAVTPRQAAEQAFAQDDPQVAAQALDTLFSSNFAERLGRAVPSLAIGVFQSRLQQMAQVTGTQPAIIYVFVRQEQLELVLISTTGSPIRFSVPDAPAEQVLARVRELQAEIVDPTRRQTTSYRPAAQQLDAWIMQPLRADLRRLGVDTLMFSLDEGLRSLPPRRSPRRRAISDRALPVQHHS